jgi:uncharacterized protein (TIGR02246 family)
MTVRDEVDQLNQTMTKAASNQDLDALMEFYAPDARLLPPGMPMLEGGEAIRGFFQAMLEAGVKGLDLESVVLDGNNDLAVDVGRYRLTMAPPGGESTIDVGKYIVVFKRQADGSLRAAYDTFNSDQAPPSG